MLLYKLCILGRVRIDGRFGYEPTGYEATMCTKRAGIPSKSYQRLTFNSQLLVNITLPQFYSLGDLAVLLTVPRVICSQVCP